MNREQTAPHSRKVNTSADGRGAITRYPGQPASETGYQEEGRMIVHINPAYPENCGNSDMTTTNHKDVNCPDCLLNIGEDRHRIANDHHKAMLQVLLMPKNAEKGGWQDIPQDKLLEYLDGELEEFYAALWSFTHHDGPIEHVISEGADVSNFLAMIIDNCKTKNKSSPQPPP